MLPLIIIAVAFLFFTYNSYQNLHQLNSLKNDVYQVKGIAHLINELQKERGRTSGYLSNPSNIVLLNALSEQQQKTDKIFRSSLAEHNLNKTFYHQRKAELLAFRAKIAHKQVTNIISLDFYSNFIRKLQNYYLMIAIHIENPSLKNYLQIYTNIALMKESLGQIRGAFNGMFSMRHTDYKLLYIVSHAKGVYDTSLERFEVNIPKPLVMKYHAIMNDKNTIRAMHVIYKYTTNYIITTDENSTQWWNQITNVMNQFYHLETDYFSFLDTYVSTQSKNVMQKLIFNALMLLFIIFILFWLASTIKNNIIKNITILEEYKNAVDRSSIVSKTNKKGIITYVNEQFCDISGYTREELLGHPHKLVRHVDMPKEAFKEMWATILAKKAWSGLVKNRKKDGSSYVVEATINPILDHNGEIEEFIAIRNDITEVIELHEELKNTQKDLIYRMSELTETRSKETGFHVRRVAKYSQLLAKYCNLSTEEIEHLTLASPMHDIGKVGIADNILHKPTKLTDEEWEIMKTHTTIGHNIFKDSNKPLLKAAGTIAHEHHEKYDGSGYPQGLKGEEIHIFARITTLADIFDALNSKRSYKDEWNDEEIFTYIKEENGKYFDPKLVKIFFKHLDEFLEIRKQYHDASAYMKEAHIP